MYFNNLFKMGLKKEAEYLYVLSKRVLKLNRELRKLGKSAEKHRGRHQKAAMHKKEKHRVRHAAMIKHVEEVMKRHNKVLETLKTHYHRFAYYLRKEHKV